MYSGHVVADARTSCDWLTRTFRDNRIREFVYDDYQIAADILRLEGHETAAWSWMGYEGMSVGGLSWGHREDTDILRASGGTAERMFSRFAHYQGGCSRIDVALTVDWPKPVLHIASEAYRKCLEGRGEGARRTYSLIVNSKGGETLYVGARASDQFGRVYDKAAEQGKVKIGTSWRYEVEFKAERAAKVLELLRSVSDRSRLYLGVVQGYFKARGVDVPPLADESLVTIDLVAPVRTVDTQLAWLRTQVRPVVARLQRLGLEAAVCEALHIER